MRAIGVMDSSVFDFKKKLIFLEKHRQYRTLFLREMDSKVIYEFFDRILFEMGFAQKPLWRIMLLV
jgi:hypothetical protein